MAWVTPKIDWAAGNIPANTDFNRAENNSLELYNDLTAHKIDYTMQIPYAGISTGAANTYAIATPLIDALVEGMAVSFKAHQDNTAACTLNWNGKGAIVLKRSDGSGAVIKAGSIYTVRYSGTNFILQGEGGLGISHGALADIPENTTITISNLGFNPLWIIVKQSIRAEKFAHYWNGSNYTLETNDGSSYVSFNTISGMGNRAPCTGNSFYIRTYSTPLYGVTWIAIG